MSISIESRRGRWVKLFVVGRRLRLNTGIQAQYVIEDVPNRQNFFHRWRWGLRILVGEL